MKGFIPHLGWKQHWPTRWRAWKDLSANDVWHLFHVLQNHVPSVRSVWRYSAEKRISGPMFYWGTSLLKKSHICASCAQPESWVMVQPRHTRSSSTQLKVGVSRKCLLEATLKRSLASCQTTTVVEKAIVQIHLRKGSHHRCWIWLRMETAVRDH